MADVRDIGSGYIYLEGIHNCQKLNQIWGML